VQSAYIVLSTAISSIEHRLRPYRLTGVIGLYVDERTKDPGFGQVHAMSRLCMRNAGTEMV
jgi:hypothetical protein